jgi:hypothetical protein
MNYRNIWNYILASVAVIFFLLFSYFITIGDRINSIYNVPILYLIVAMIFGGIYLHGALDRIRDKPPNLKGSQRSAKYQLIQSTSKVMMGTAAVIFAVEANLSDPRLRADLGLLALFLLVVSLIFSWRGRNI